MDDALLGGRQQSSGAGSGLIRLAMTELRQLLLQPPQPFLQFQQSQGEAFPHLAQGFELFAQSL